MSRIQSWTTFLLKVLSLNIKGSVARITNSKVGIAIYRSKAFFKAYHHLALNFKFIKGSVYNLQKKQAGAPLYSDMVS